VFSCDGSVCVVAGAEGSWGSGVGNEWADDGGYWFVIACWRAAFSGLENSSCLKAASMNERKKIKEEKTYELMAGHGTLC
jgi:hypothetical protein